MGRQPGQRARRAAAQPAGAAAVSAPTVMAVQEDVRPLQWSTPGAAFASFYLSEIAHTSIHATLMPNAVFDRHVSTHVGLPGQGVLDVNGFEDVYRVQPVGSPMYVTVILMNLSPTEKRLQLRFVFSGDLSTEQRYNYTLAPGATVYDSIPVNLVA